MSDNIESTKKDISEKVERQVKGVAAVSRTCSTTAAERPGIVYGDFSGNMLADASSKWLRELLDSNGLKYEDSAARGTRPKALTFVLGPRLVLAGLAQAEEAEQLVPTR